MKNYNRILLAGSTLMLFAIASCKNSPTSVNVSAPQRQVGQSITSDTLSGAVKGTLLTGKTYYFTNDVVVNAGDTLLLQNNVHLIALPPADPTNAATPSPQISVYGTFISLGSKDAPNWISVPDNRKSYAAMDTGLWGGIQCGPTAGDCIVKWTHIEYCGGPAGAASAFVTQGDHRFAIWYQNVQGHLILEDSWIHGSVDDPVRVSGGHISIYRNTFEHCGSDGGDGPNIKSGTVGDIAYNVFIGSATNGAKLSNKGGAPVQTDVNIYNNTFVNCGYRMTESGRAGSTNIEEGARGVEYNNLIVNCRTGFRLVGNPIADTAHTYYDYQYYYAQNDSIHSQFYPIDGIQVPKPHDVAPAVGQGDPKFVNYNVNLIDFNSFNPYWPQADNAQPQYMDLVDADASHQWNFRLQSGSPCIGKGTTTVPADAAAGGVQIPMPNNVTVGGDFGADQQGLGGDLGAYESNGSGNQH